MAASFGPERRRESPATFDGEQAEWVDVYATTLKTLQPDRSTAECVLSAQSAWPSARQCHPRMMATLSIRTRASRHRRD